MSQIDPNEALRAGSIGPPQSARTARSLPCPECDDEHSVTVWGEPELKETFDSEKKRRKDPLLEPSFVEIFPNRHRRPCSTCCHERYELYMAGHFEADHVANGGCRECYPYTAAAIRGGRRK